MACGLALALLSVISRGTTDLPDTNGGQLFRSRAPLAVLTWEVGKRYSVENDGVIYTGIYRGKKKVPDGTEVHWLSVESTEPARHDVATEPNDHADQPSAPAEREGSEVEILRGEPSFSTTLGRGRGSRVPSGVPGTAAANGPVPELRLFEHAGQGFTTGLTLEDQMKRLAEPWTTRPAQSSDSPNAVEDRSRFSLQPLTPPFKSDSLGYWDRPFPQPQTPRDESARDYHSPSPSQAYSPAPYLRFSAHQLQPDFDGHLQPTTPFEPYPIASIPWVPYQGEPIGYVFGSHGPVREKIDEVRDKLAQVNTTDPTLAAATRIGASMLVDADQAELRGQEELALSLTAMANELADTALGLIPLVGWVKDIVEAETGRRVVDGSALSPVERGMAIFGAVTVGLGSKIKVFAKLSNFARRYALKAMTATLIRTARIDSRALRAAGSIAAQMDGHLADFLRLLKEEIRSRQWIGKRLEVPIGGTNDKLIFRRDIGHAAHPISNKWDFPVNHYNIEVHASRGPGRYRSFYNMHVVLDAEATQILDVFSTGSKAISRSQP